MNLYHLPCRPLRWLARFRHRCGYGIHSPFAFGFVTSVVYEAGLFYAYPHLDRLWAGARRQGQTGLRRKDVRLLFRLANFAQARRGVFCGVDRDGVALAALREGCKLTRWMPFPELRGQADFVLLGEGWEKEAGRWTEVWAEGGVTVVLHPASSPTRSR